MNKSSKVLRGFGIALAIFLTSIVTFFLLAQFDPYCIDIAMWSLAIFSLIIVCFTMYFKELVVKENWSKFPFAFRTVWWFIFTMNSFNFTYQFMTTFIF
ncbi:hypothetical protein [Priestia megaterium]|uniref:hypothetical protein n=1 Tax=Priestia megaterium TaxID=1404 RepID=UPI000BFEA84D|nr:hypothetical protein [Priestia megaterium]MBW0934209.1 hypothetical protein [Priestia megaterium]PGX80591.1 hypothetical protein COE31_04545 [Priestia megaterium]